MGHEVVFLHYETSSAAERAMATIHMLVAEGFLELDEAAIITRSDDGWVSVKPIGRSDLATKATLGGVLGVIAGALIGLPVIGAVAGAGAAAKQSSGNDQFDELMDAAGREMAAGTAVLALTVAGLTDPESVVARLEIHRDRLIRAEIPASLRAQLDEASGS
ncbi:MAG: DUF1269 domain-containing protein [Acidimicrobiia bacterium]|nr:DUF1269 domain-containing protein [Acidimicrobiia bacterium]